jgi:hypothetical protein
MKSIVNLTSQQLRRAAGIKDQITSLEKKLNQIFVAPAQTTPTPRKRRKMSATARRKIAAAARARWAKRRGTKAPKLAARPKRKISAAVRKRLAQLARVRWAKAKAAGKKTL